MTPEYYHTSAESPPPPPHAPPEQPVPHPHAQSVLSPLPLHALPAPAPFLPAPLPPTPSESGFANDIPPLTLPNASRSFAIALVVFVPETEFERAVPWLDTLADRCAAAPAPAETGQPFKLGHAPMFCAYALPASKLDTGLADGLGKYADPDPEPGSEGLMLGVYDPCPWPFPFPFPWPC
ncbi:hypothetical protein C0989_003847 [Termitomyces sp. Mn162]|nr:hypothetical protein C0989_003847 [Termitomyces sp. Mn162]